jgi:Rrf2 family protein
MKLFSKLCEYAVRALIVLARENGRRIQVKSICDRDALPVHFTRKALQTLSRHKIVEASRGPQGGYLLRKAPARIRIFDLLRIFDAVEKPAGCILGPRHCPPKRPCSLKNLWNGTQKRVMNELKQITIADLT